ncbi:DUF4212 domain-containing protein [Glaciimonas sp. GG7]
MDARQHTAVNNARHWRRTKTLTFSLLLIWALMTFLVIFFARELSGVTLFGWPLSFYMAAQGLGVTYLAIVAVYTWQMGRIDREAAMTVADQQERAVNKPLNNILTTPHEK